jgi:sterol desaturase/sphingolipid hydroxylase (fatty acid hydroxylase superfamily)
MLLRLAEWITIGSLPAFLLLDLIARRRTHRATRWWRLRALVVSAAIFVLSMVVGAGWAGVLEGRSLLPGHRLGMAGGALVGILAYELVHYWYHRLAHRWDPLWRAAHQMHHSAESLDAFGAYYLHPLDAFLFTTWSSLVLFGVLGLSAEAGLLAGCFLAFSAVFQHADIRTPRWLGYLVQRPESHSVHHERGVHAHNYSDLPLWDMVFGTFRNPAGMAREQGFWHGASARIGSMLIGRDVSLEPAQRSAAGGSARRSQRQPAIADRTEPSRMPRRAVTP